jgi:uncharacterized protein YbjT (DUF2867 family)
MVAMDVVIAGGHGQIALRLQRLLSGDGHRARALIRNPVHAADVMEAGGEPVLCDLEASDDLAEAVRGADAVVFAAGAGPGSGPARKRTVDYEGAVKLIDACRATGVERYVMVSSIGADRPELGQGPMGPYLQAKADADAALQASGLSFTIVRPGGLTDEPGTGRVALADHLGRRGSIPRDDVAAVVAAVLSPPRLVGRTVVLLSGSDSIDDALAAATRPSIDPD